MPDEEKLIAIEIRQAYGDWYRSVRDAGDKFLDVAGTTGDDLLDAVEAVQAIVSFLPNPRQIPGAQ